jgi:hypothetical protein
MKENETYDTPSSRKRLLVFNLTFNATKAMLRDVHNSNKKAFPGEGLNVFSVQSNQMMISAYAVTNRLTQFQLQHQLLLAWQPGHRQ